MREIKIDLNPKIPPLRKVEDKTKIDVRYMVLSPFASIHIYWDEKEKEVVYDVEEPLLTDDEKKKLGEIENAMREVVNLGLLGKNVTPQSLANYIQKTALLIIDEFGMKVSEDSFKKIFYFLYRDFIGLNEIEPLMRDYFIEDIECNGLNEPIYIVHRVFRNLRTNVRFTSLDRLTGFVEKLAQKCGRYISYANPILDGSLPDGSRVNATYTQDITSKGPTFTIRKFTRVPWTPIQLLSFHTLSAEMLAYFWILLEYKANLMIVGATASGKTTLLNAIAFFIPLEDRVVSIEDTRELNLPRENWLPAVVRSGITGTGVGEVDMFSLLKGSFRQNPDYVIVGEVRGKEAYVLFQGMASGHASISTMHADSVDAVIRRLETPPINLNPMLVNGLDAVSIMTHAVVDGNQTRRLRKIVEITKVQADGIALTNTVYEWEPSRDRFRQKKESKVFKKISDKYGVPLKLLKKEHRIRTKLIEAMLKDKILSYDDVQKVIKEYQKSPKAVLKRFKIRA